MSAHLKDGVHDAAEGPVVGELCHSEDVKGPLIQVLQLLFPHDAHTYTHTHIHTHTQTRTHTCTQTDARNDTHMHTDIYIFRIERLHLTH